MERPIKELTEDEVNEYLIIKAALDAGATVKKVKNGEGGIYLRGRKLSTKEGMDCIFNPDFKPTMTNADRIRSMRDEELANWYFSEFFPNAPYCNKLECYRDSPCEQCLLDWLRTEVTE